MSETCKTNQEQLTLKEKLKTWMFWKPVLFTALGGLGGFLYYYFVGCPNGTCAITGNPWSSIAFGGFFGFFLVNRPCAC
jgi:hypothetical protein